VDFETEQVSLSVYFLVAINSGCQISHKSAFVKGEVKNELYSLQHEA